MHICCKPIKGYDAFSVIFKTGKKQKTKYIFSSVVFNKNIVNNNTHTIYYGVTISKKLVKNAVIRNRIKRLLRESIRLLLKEFEEIDLVAIENIILAWQVAPKNLQGISLDCVMPAVKNIFEQVFSLYHKKQNNDKIKENGIQS